MAHTKAPEVRGARLLKHPAMLALGLVLGVASLCAGQAFVSEVPAVELQQWTDGAKPPFGLQDLQGTNATLAERSGKIVLVHFCATWCEPCRDELPALRRLVERSNAAGIEVLAISVAEVDERVRRFVEKVPVNFPILLDRDRAVTLLARLQTEIPELVLVGHPDRRLPNTLNVLFPGVSGRKLLEACPRVFASTGSACHADREEASAILTGIGIDPQRALGAVRLSVGCHTTIEDTEMAAASLVAAWRLICQPSGADANLIPAL